MKTINIDAFKPVVYYKIPTTVNEFKHTVDQYKLTALVQELSDPFQYEGDQYFTDRVIRDLDHLCALVECVTTDDYKLQYSVIYHFIAYAFPFAHERLWSAIRSDIRTSHLGFRIPYEKNGMFPEYSPLAWKKN